ncbi:magnesium transporter [Kushneria sinocarnis]|uniref:Magnesium transport protein CorA n=1 Tax=Kushneria sinocarnis TaxID=595502 RepID=A0A420WZK5_9GAMM|nr:magnesium/cobalt transporter CorA [Kushneria sinocarnis]RKR06776.1 magnesium transporter [Kushneria sinocarnis]
MIRTFILEHQTIQELADAPLSDRLARATWIDAHEADENEREALNAFLADELPASTDVEEIESSARYFADADGVHVHSLFLSRSEGKHSNATVAFILQSQRLITLREDDLADFRLLRLRARHGQIEVDSPPALMVTVFEQKAENLADSVEDMHRDLEQVSQLVLEEEDADLEDAIDRLAKVEDSVGKIRLCLMDTQRSLHFLLRHLRRHPELQEQAREVLQDVDALMSHTTFLSDKVNFLMDTTQGFINIQQNQIIKIFSIASVVFLPPTMIASIYGMNFDVMPELHWPLGYPLAIGVMFLSGLSPYLYFKHRGWL